MDKEKLILEALDNIRNDRTTTESLLVDLQQEINQNQVENVRAGLVAAKYVETLQRSNEQLVKVASLVQKKTSKNQAITEEDKQELFDLINGETDD